MRLFNNPKKIILSPLGYGDVGFVAHGYYAPASTLVFFNMGNIYEVVIVYPNKTDTL